MNMPVNEFAYLVIIDGVNEGLYAIGTNRPKPLEYFEKIGALKEPIAAVYFGDHMTTLKQVKQFTNRFDKTNWREAKPMDIQEVRTLIESYEEARKQETESFMKSFDGWPLFS